MTEYPVVVDVSKWNGRMNWDRTKAMGVSARIIRAGSIDPYTGKPAADIQFKNNAVVVDDLPILAAYWYFMPDFAVEPQANLFAELLTKYNIRWPAFDFEYSANLPKRTLSDRMEQFILTTWRYMGIEHGLNYTRASWWNEYVDSRPLWSKLHLWIAIYNSNLIHPWKGLTPRYKPHGYEDFVLWQREENPNGFAYGNEAPPYGGRKIDINVFNGTKEEMMKLFFGVTPPVVPQPPAEKPPAVAKKVEVYGLNPGVHLRIRSKPSLDGTVIGWTKNGEIHSVLDEAPSFSPGIPWYKIGEDRWIYGGYAKVV